MDARTCTVWIASHLHTKRHPGFTQFGSRYAKSISPSRTVVERLPSVTLTHSYGVRQQKHSDILGTASRKPIFTTHCGRPFVVVPETLLVLLVLQVDASSFRLPPFAAHTAPNA